MKNALIVMLVIAAAIGCQRVPLSGRKQLILISNAELLPMSFTSYRGVIDTSRVVSSSNEGQLIKRVGNRLKDAVESYMRTNNFASRIEGFQWEFNLIQSPQINAWCMPGGKVAVYTGILPYTQNEAGLATVMGHEISHAIAEHGNERMSESLLANNLIQGGQAALGAVAQARPQQTNALLLQAAGVVLPVAYQVGRALPHSRKQESEADKLGLVFMAMAGYNPNEAVGFWTRMSKAGSGKKPPEFLSTHPSDSRRIRDIQSELPEALKYYNSGRR